MRQPREGSLQEHRRRRQLEADEQRVSDGSRLLSQLRHGYRSGHDADAVSGSRQPRGLFKSTDGAHSWVPANEGFTGSSALSVAVDPSNPSTLYAGVVGFPNTGVFKSTDAANSWNMVLDAAGLGSLDVLTVAPSDSSIIYLGAGINTIFKSTDGGDNWNSVSTGLDDAFEFNQITVHPTNPDFVYAATGSGLFKTTNGGTSWGLLTTLFFGIFSVVLDPTNPMIVYAANTGAILKSTNGGGGFVEQDDVFAGAQLNSLAIDPQDPQTLYAGSWWPDALFKSTDGGNTWVVSNAGLRNQRVSSIAFDPQNLSTILCGHREWRSP